MFPTLSTAEDKSQITLVCDYFIVVLNCLQALMWPEIIHKKQNKKLNKKQTMTFLGF